MHIPKNRFVQDHAPLLPVLAIGGTSVPIRFADKPVTERTGTHHYADINRQYGSMTGDSGMEAEGTGK